MSYISTNGSSWILFLKSNFLVKQLFSSWFLNDLFSFFLGQWRDLSVRAQLFLATCPGVSAHLTGAFPRSVRGARDTAGGRGGRGEAYLLYFLLYLHVCCSEEEKWPRREEASCRAANNHTSDRETDRRHTTTARFTLPVVSLLGRSCEAPSTEIYLKGFRPGLSK